MKTLIMIILSIVQGATEFLPISSSGHLVLFYQIFNIQENTIFLSVILHLATLLSILVYYRKELLALLKHPFCKTTYMLIVSTLCSLVIVIFLLPVVEKSFAGDSLITCFLITAILLVIGENLKLLSKNSTYDYKNALTSVNLGYKQAIGMGIMQGLACFPGISRSGSTMATGLFLGGEKTSVANYSFLMSLPIVFASLVYELYKFIKEPSPMYFNWLELSIGFITAFVVGILSIKLMLKLVKKQKLTWFAFYLVLLSLFLVLNRGFFHLF